MGYDAKSLPYVALLLLKTLEETKIGLGTTFVKHNPPPCKALFPKNVLFSIEIQRVSKIFYRN